MSLRPPSISSATAARRAGATRATILRRRCSCATYTAPVIRRRSRRACRRSWRASRLFEEVRPSQRPLGGHFDLLGSADHRAVARQAVRESLVLLKNDNHLLPLRPGANILVTGDGADNVSRQAGGWTITWQGTNLTNENFPGATSIFAGIRETVAAAGGSATLSADGSYTRRPDAAIVVFGEEPYAE